MPSRSRRYQPIQIVLHWSVVVLVALQYATGSSIERVHHADARGHAPDPLDLALHALHNRSGLLIVFLTLVRLALRWRLGAPAPLSSRAGPFGLWQARLAGVTHALIYAALLCQGLTGAVASYLSWTAAPVHAALANVTLGLIGLHVGAALWHLARDRDRTWRRMVGRDHDERGRPQAAIGNVSPEAPGRPTAAVG